MRLRNFVHVLDSEDKAHTFGPDSDVPSWAVEKITNPKAWADEPGRDDVLPEFEDFHEKLKGAAAVDPVEVQEPPRAGKGSSLEAWQAYAKTKGLTDADLEGASRDDLIATVGSKED
jgi:hypothetical protein